MSGKKIPKPIYPLNYVKKLIKENKINFNWKTIHAFEDFGWKSEEIKKCLLKLNDRYHPDNPLKNHFYKSELHRIEKVHIDVYRAVNIMEGNDVYIYLYIDQYFDRLIVYSFKKLDIYLPGTTKK
jgi:Motility quorum-sensing regulator, toxin of MqsA